METSEPHNFPYDKILHVSALENIVVSNSNINHLTITVEGVSAGGTLWQRAKSAWGVLTKSFPISRGLLIQDCVIKHIDTVEYPEYPKLEMPTVAAFPIVEDPSAQFANGNLEGLYGKETMQKALCIDFDGTLHKYSSGWQGDDIVQDPPVDGAVEACHALAEAGWKLYVLSSRTKLHPVAEWLAKYKFPPMTLTRVKPIAVVYIDDRGYRFEGNWDSLRKLWA